MSRRSKPFSGEKRASYPLSTRRSKVKVEHFSRVYTPQESMKAFVSSLPDILGGKDFKDFLSLMKRAGQKKKAILWAMGAHVLKLGLSPVIIDLMEKGWISGLALNGACLVHDFEIAYAGHTSEDVQEEIKTGRFGMARETGEMLNRAINTSRSKGSGLGETVAAWMQSSSFRYKHLSLLAASARLGVPVTVHVALGTDIIHSHPLADGEAIGGASLRDFHRFCSLVESLDGGGVFVHVGSAVVLPEVFLKAVTVVRSRGISLEEFSAAVFDFRLLYRPHQNVVKRPLGRKGKGFYFIGQHEIMIPLLAASLKSLSP